MTWFIIITVDMIRAHLKGGYYHQLKRSINGWNIQQLTVRELLNLNKDQVYIQEEVFYLIMSINNYILIMISGSNFINI